MDPTTDTVVAPVRKTVTVRATRERAFEVFTADFDSWWPHSHHIGASPMTRAIIEQKTGGRCYAEQIDGTDCDWGTVLVWEPPARIVLAWQINTDWTFQPDLAKSSEVEVRFTAEPGGLTRVDLEHRLLERHGAGAGTMRSAIDSEGGWGSLMKLYADRIATRG